ncbi:MAG TPA: flagellar biosynthetic protein FliO [Rhizomicrobium sp.]|nr:flagellar biosynthetic protein FliO [Rhizomicrobium sp.]
MDVIDFGRYFAALLLVGALIGLAWLAARRYGLAGIVQGTAAKRLSVVESLMIGPKHKLVIVKRDDREHLILLAPDGNTLIESSTREPANA